MADGQQGSSAEAVQRGAKVAGVLGLVAAGLMAVPAHVYAATKANATRAQLSADGNGVVDAAMEGHAINYYEVPVLWTTLQVIYDLWSRRYRVTGLNNRGAEHNFDAKLSQRDFSPSSLRRTGFR